MDSVQIRIEFNFDSIEYELLRWFEIKLPTKYPFFRVSFYTHYAAEKKFESSQKNC